MSTEIRRLHILIAEALRCLEEGKSASVRRKIGYADVLLCELEALLTSQRPPTEETAAPTPPAHGPVSERFMRHHYGASGVTVWPPPVDPQLGLTDLCSIACVPARHYAPCLKAGHPLTEAQKNDIDPTYQEALHRPVGDWKP